MSVAERETQNLADEVRRLQKSPEELRRFLAGAVPFDPARWRSSVPMATPEELADMHAFLAERELERERSLAAEAPDD